MVVESTQAYVTFLIDFYSDLLGVLKKDLEICETVLEIYFVDN